MPDTAEIPDKEPGTVSVGLNFDPADVPRLDAIQRTFGLEDHEAVNRLALVLLDWAAEESVAGRAIGSYDPAMYQGSIASPAPLDPPQFVFRSIVSVPKDFFRSITVVKPWWKRFLGGA